MGMAASQARYLGLAARKTNCEYQGQQINQARTALANQSAELWNQMLGLSVPVVPHTQDFTKTQYAFNDGYNSFEITSMVPTDYIDENGVEYNYAVKYRYFEKEVEGLQRTNTNPQVQDTTVSEVVISWLDEPTTTTASYAMTKSTAGVYTITGGDTLATCDASDMKNLNLLYNADGTATLNAADYRKYTDAAGKVQYISTADLDALCTTPDVEANGDLTFGTVNRIPNQTRQMVNTDTCRIGNSLAEKVDLSDPEIITSLRKIMEDNPGTNMADAIRRTLDAYENATGTFDPANNEIFTYVKNGSVYYSCSEDIANSYASGIRPSADPHTLSGIDRQDALASFYTASVEVEKVTTDYAILDDASGSGRFSTIKLSDYSSPFDLKTETSTNDVEYQDAMNQYYYDVQNYEKKQADINAKTKSIQEQDRTLELRLKQLDTEHNALQTEMEAVKKVLTKNIEDTFKTFGG